MKAYCEGLYHFWIFIMVPFYLYLVFHLEDWAHYLSFAAVSKSRIYLVCGISIKLHLVSQLNIENNE